MDASLLDGVVIGRAGVLLDDIRQIVEKARPRPDRIGAVAVGELQRISLDVSAEADHRDAAGRHGTDLSKGSQRCQGTAVFPEVEDDQGRLPEGDLLQQRSRSSPSGSATRSDPGYSAGTNNSASFSISKV